MSSIAESTRFAYPFHAAFVLHDPGGGILIHGSSGSGKTTLSNALARLPLYTKLSDDLTYLLVRDGHLSAIPISDEILETRDRIGLIPSRDPAHETYKVALLVKLSRKGGGCEIDWNPPPASFLPSVLILGLQRDITILLRAIEGTRKVFFESCPLEKLIEVIRSLMAHTH